MQNFGVVAKALSTNLAPRMNWGMVAAIAELLGALGVIASLMYLATQVRSSALQAKHAAAQSVLNQVQSVAGSLAANPQLADVYARGLRGLEHLKGDGELLQFSGCVLSAFRPYEELYYYHQAGVIDDWTWRSVEALLGAQASSLGFGQWWQLRRSFFSPEFQAYLSTTISGEGRDVLGDYREYLGVDSEGGRAS